MGWAKIAGLVGGSRFRHVAISDGQVVVNFDFLKRAYWAHDAYVNANEVLGHVEIESDQALDLRLLPAIDRTDRMVRTSAQFILMGLTRGLYQVENCTTSAKQACWGAGVEVPDRSVWCPTKLLLWLMENGKDFVAGPPPQDGGTTDFGAGQSESAGDGGLSCDQC